MKPNTEKRQLKLAAVIIMVVAFTIIVLNTLQILFISTNIRKANTKSYEVNLGQILPKQNMKIVKLQMI